MTTILKQQELFEAKNRTLTYQPLQFEFFLRHLVYYTAYATAEQIAIGGVQSSYAKPSMTLLGHEASESCSN